MIKKSYRIQVQTKHINKSVSVPSYVIEFFARSKNITFKESTNYAKERLLESYRLTGSTTYQDSHWLASALLMECLPHERF